MTIELKPEAIEGKARMTDEELVSSARVMPIRFSSDASVIDALCDAVERLTRERDEALRRRIVYSPDAKALSDRAEAAERKVEKLREALKAMLREHDILSENDPSVRRGTDRWPTSAGLARASLAETENTNQYHLHKGVSIND